MTCVAVGRSPVGPSWARRGRRGALRLDSRLRLRAFINVDVVCTVQTQTMTEDVSEDTNSDTQRSHWQSQRSESQQYTEIETQTTHQSVESPEAQYQRQSHLSRCATTPKVTLNSSIAYFTRSGHPQCAVCRTRGHICQDSSVGCQAELPQLLMVARWCKCMEDRKSCSRATRSDESSRMMAQ